MTVFLNLLHRWESAELNDDATAVHSTFSRRGGGDRLDLPGVRTKWGRLLPDAQTADPEEPDARVKVHVYPDGSHALFHGPRCIGRYAADGALKTTDEKCAA